MHTITKRPSAIQLDVFKTIALTYIFWYKSVEVNWISIPEVATFKCEVKYMMDKLMQKEYR